MNFAVRQRASQVTKESCGDNHSDCPPGSKTEEVVWLRSQVTDEEQDTPHADIITLTAV